MILLSVLCFGLGKKTEFVIDLMEHGITAPRFTENPAYRTTKNTYAELPGELTKEGMYQMQINGKELRKEFVEDSNFLPKEFKPQHFYHKTYRDQPSTLSAYASMLGLYPDSIGWIQYQNMGYSAAEAPFTREEETDVRKALGLPLAPNKLTTRDLTIWAENNGRTFFNDPLNNCPQMHKQMNENLDIANKKYTENKRFDALYEAMEKTLGVPDNVLNFKNAHLYLDDYVTAQANKRSFPEFDEQLAANTWISNYFRRYYYEGRYGNDLNLAKIASTDFFTYTLIAMYGKMKTIKGEITNDHYTNLKYTQFVGNENSLIAADKILNDNPSDPLLPPRFGSNLRFELFENGGKYFVRSSIEEVPLKMKGATDGVMPYEDFMNYLYSSIYYGDIDRYCQGQENPADRMKSTYANYEKYVFSQSPDLKGQQKAVATQTDDGSTFFEQKFVELGQREAPKVVEIQEPVIVTRPSPPMGRVPSYYLNEFPTEYQRYSAARQSYSQTPPRYTRYEGAQVAAAPPTQTRYQTSQTSYAPPPQQPAPIIAAQPPVQRGEFSQMVETSKCACGPKQPAAAPLGVKYNPNETREYKVDIPYLHPVDVPQVIHDTRYVMVPQPVVQTITKPVIQEKLVREKPTEVHHIKLEKAAVAAPIQFVQETPKIGWPWWWWIPLVLLCCCLPLLCCLSYFLCCK